MARALAHAVCQPLPDAAELLRLLLVTGCAAALIAAGQALPALGL